jgi:hypothetical protein
VVEVRLGRVSKNSKVSNREESMLGDIFLNTSTLGLRFPGLSPQKDGLVFLPERATDEYFLQELVSISLA